MAKKDFTLVSPVANKKKQLRARTIVHTAIEISEPEWNVQLLDDTPVVLAIDGDVVTVAFDGDGDPVKVPLKSFEWQEEFGWVLVLAPKATK